MDATKGKTLKIVFASIGSVVLLGLTIFVTIRWEKLKIRLNAFRYKYFASDSKTDNCQPETVPPVPLPFIPNSDSSDL